MSISKSNLKIDILLPPKEAFSEANSGAVANYVHDTIRESKSSFAIRVFGRHVATPFADINFVPLKPTTKWFYGQNLGFARTYLNILKDHSKPDLIEIHGRCNVASYVAKKRPDIPVTLFLPNDPRDMKGSKSISERRSLITELAQIVCVSNYIRECFLDGLNVNATEAEKVLVFPLGIKRKLEFPPLKEPIIFMAGRMVPEKGILEAATALTEILPYYPEWRLVIAGARRFENADPGSYEAKIGEVIEPLGKQAQMTGFIPLKAVRDWQQRAAIAACPSLWQEPLGKVVIEALAAGCAVLTTRCGGIPEVAEGRAMIINKPSISAFRNGFETLLNNDQLRCKLQKKAWNDFPFTSAEMANKVDAIRRRIFSAN